MAEDTEGFNLVDTQKAVPQAGWDKGMRGRGRGRFGRGGRGAGRWQTAPMGAEAKFNAKFNAKKTVTVRAHISICFGCTHGYSCGYSCGYTVRGRRCRLLQAPSPSNMERPRAMTPRGVGGAA